MKSEESIAFYIMLESRQLIKKVYDKGQFK